MNPFWLVPIEQQLARLHANRAGLAGDDAAARLAGVGRNESSRRRSRRWPADLLRRVANPLIGLLLVAAGIAGFTGDYVSFALIVSIVGVSTVLDAVQQRRAEATADALKRTIAIRACVLRDGTPREVPVAEVVPGDIVRVAAGDLVPADGILLEALALQVNESLLTGEPFPVPKRIDAPAGAGLAEAANALFQGTAVVSGSGTMLAVATASATRLGAIAASLSAEPLPTAFERGIHRFGVLVLRLTVFLVLFVLLAHLALGRDPLQAFLFAMALAVGLTPELLPMIMTVTLARGAERLAAARVVVKRLSAIHDLGEMDILCTDKTGTLTEARIALVGHPGPDSADDDRVLELAAVNARFETGIKSPLDEAVLLHCSGRSFSDWTKLDERPFDFERRRVSVLAEQAGSRREIVKGAPETILALCTHAQARDGALAPVDAALRTRLDAMLADKERQGLRVLAVAWQHADNLDHLSNGSDRDLILAGFCLFVDPPKPSAAAAVARLDALGCRIKIVSGDAAPVLEHLVTELALPVTGTLTGEDIAGLSDQALAARVGEVDLFARVTPDQKMRVVQALRARGHTVGFVGDGINDAPAIRAADVGLSVAGATDVARDAADMILLDTDLGVLADGVEEGRRTYANIMKYIRMGTSSNFGNMLTMAVASAWLPFLPLTAVQVLLNNFLYDLSQLGIPFDRSDPEDVARPRGWNMKELLRFTLVMGGLSSLFDLATFALLVQLLHASIAEFRSAWFIESMATQVLVIFVIRTMHRPWRSRAHPMLVLSCGTILAAAMVLPWLPVAGLLGFTALDAATIAMIGAITCAYLVSAEFLKRVAINRCGAGVMARRAAAAPASRLPIRGRTAGGPAGE